MEQNNCFLAHSENTDGIVQTIKEHSLGVGNIMRKFAIAESFKDLYEYCGLIHDMGKYSCEFQRHIEGEIKKVKHSIYGALYARNNNLMEIALPIFGHHAGLPNIGKMNQDFMEELNTGDNRYADIHKRMEEDFDHSIKRPDDRAFKELSDILLQELFVRMIFSSLVDADSLDTEKHFFQRKNSSRISIQFNPDLLLEKLQRKLSALENDPTKKGLIINGLRNEVRLYAESKANSPQGCFSLTLPTGLGKTLCSINWALHHAQSHRNIQRIIIVLPFISIIDQTAQELKAIFNENEIDYVLEHHSNVIYSGDEGRDIFDPRQLATENWEYPIIITTSVQFFESLFSNKRSACRKLHNIQDSIIIFDEIQSLPLYISEPTIKMLDNLRLLCRCSILFCTATQPDFRTRSGFSGIDHIEPLVKNPQYIFDKTRRVTYHSINDYNEITISELADKVMRKGTSALIVFNTKKKALLFYKEMIGCGKFKLFHLSTNMCPAHRKETIKKIKEELEKKGPIVVCSTQLIEAGVDLDFPSVYRELAPLESIIQSAGRCNREGKLRDENGKFTKGCVYLFTLTEPGQPSKQYRSWSEYANLLYKGKEDKLYTHDFYEEYYRKLIDNFVDTDKFKITEDRRQLNFQKVADKYRIIDNNTQPIFVYNYNDESRIIYDRIKGSIFITRQDRQELSQFCVQVYEQFMKNNNCHIVEEPCGIKVWYGRYDSNFGLTNSYDFNPII